uniref:DDE Tnp4 domain-containing protein n=1 Tax=Xenopus tropicalis TaxID=8364 RepID=A0A803JES1_XENTR
IGYHNTVWLRLRSDYHLCSSTLFTFSATHIHILLLVTWYIIKKTSHAVPGMVKLLCSLHFLATGSFQRLGGVYRGVSQPTFSQCLGQVLDAIHLVQFYGVSGIPNVLVMCDARMNMSIVSGFPGSSHDGDWKQLICLQHLITSYFISGDAGYLCSRWLITPIHRLRTRAECAFNKAHVRAWSVIERTFGVIKSRFRCLDKLGGSLMYSPSKVAQIVVVCAVLHNLPLIILKPQFCSVSTFYDHPVLQNDVIVPVPTLRFTGVKNRQLCFTPNTTERHVSSIAGISNLFYL